MNMPKENGKKKRGPLAPGDESIGFQVWDNTCKPGGPPRIIPHGTIEDPTTGEVLEKPKP